MIYVGIDPGASGGIAVLSADGRVLHVGPTPETPHDVVALYREWVSDDDAVRAVLEKVHSSPQMGVASAFSFGASYGMLRMMLVATDTSFDEVPPQRWQKAIGGLASAKQKRVDGRGFKGRDKNVTKARAQQLFPGQKVTHATADALLIAEYCRRLHIGLPALVLPVSVAEEELF